MRPANQLEPVQRQTCEMYPPILASLLPRSDTPAAQRFLYDRETVPKFTPLPEALPMLAEMLLSVISRLLLSLSSSLLSWGLANLSLY